MHKKNNNILIICSWLGLDSLLGDFFKEQAEILLPEANPVLATFESIEMGVRTFLKNKNLYEIETKKTNLGVKMHKIQYAQFWFLPQMINKKIRDGAIIKLHDFLNSNHFSPAIIHAQSLMNGGIWASKYSEKYQIPYIFTEHSQLSFRNCSVEKGKLISKIVRKADKCIAVSNDKIRQFVANGIYADFENIGNLISDFYDYKNQPKNQPKILKLSTIGTYSPRKDQKTLLDALSLIDNQLNGYRIELCWVGCNAENVDNEKEVDKLLSNYYFNNISIKVIPLIFDKKELARILQQSDLFVLTSISEGQPVSVLEALACGVPVFSTNCGGVDEIIHEKNGKIFQIKDSHRLKALIMDFISGKNSYDRKIISEDILQKFNKKAFKNSLLNIYQPYFK